MRILAADISEEVVGKRLRDFSHIGEHTLSRQMDDRVDYNNPPIIASIDKSDDNNVVTIVIGDLAERQRVRDENHAYVLERIPFSGTMEVGIAEGGWIEVEE